MIKNMARWILRDELVKCENAASVISQLEYESVMSNTNAGKALDRCTQICMNSETEINMLNLENSRLLAQLALVKESNEAK